MSHTDPIADMLTRIRNGILVEKKEVSIPLSKVKLDIARIFKQEGYISNFTVNNNEFPPQLIVELKYMKKVNAIEGLKKISKPGRRVYADVENIPKVLGGLGIAIMSTSKGIMTGRDCIKNHVGGEVLLHVW
jgi:small subunit ribosomal protein S8